MTPLRWGGMEGSGVGLGWGHAPSAGDLPPPPPPPWWWWWAVLTWGGVWLGRVEVGSHWGWSQGGGVVWAGSVSRAWGGASV